MSSQNCLFNKINLQNYIEDENYKIVKLKPSRAPCNSKIFIKSDVFNDDYQTGNIFTFDKEYLNEYIYEALYIDIKENNPVLHNNISIHTYESSKMHSLSEFSFINENCKKIKKYVDDIFNTTEYVQLYTFCIMGNIAIDTQSSIMCFVESFNSCTFNFDLYAKIKKRRILFL